jgi:DNA phosphorothioation-associated DGQHR protein 1
MTRKVVSKKYVFSCISVKQGFDKFYACSISAKVLLEICEPVRAEVLEEDIVHGALDISVKKSIGTQRQLTRTRPEQIKEYIKSGVAAFPNSIIIGANISEEGFLLDEDDQTWRVDNNQLTIAEGALSAAIIDGQHRLSGFGLLDENDPSLNDDLLCSIYLNIPMTYHAQIFSTINSTQRRVHKNLIYQLYQIDMDEKEPKYWSPEVLAVYIARALGGDKMSPLKDRVVLALEKDDLIKTWNVSLSSLVEGVLKLISDTPQRDKDAFYSKIMEQKTRKDLVKDSAVWRDLYLNQRDKIIYENILNYFKICFYKINDDSAYKSSIGCTALLEALKELLAKENFDINKVQENLSDCLESINQHELPRDKTTKNKSLLRDVLIASFVNRRDLDVSHKFHKKTINDFDLYFEK